MLLGGAGEYSCQVRNDDCMSGLEGLLVQEKLQLGALSVARSSLLPAGAAQFYRIFEHAADLQLPETGYQPSNPWPGQVKEWAGMCLSCIFNSFAFILVHCRQAALLALAVARFLEAQDKFMAVSGNAVADNKALYNQVPMLRMDYWEMRRQVIEDLAVDSDDLATLLLNRYDSARDSFSAKVRLTRLGPQAPPFTGCARLLRDRLRPPTNPAELDVCIRGVSWYTQQAPPLFAHFLHGHVMETLALLVQSSLLPVRLHATGRVEMLQQSPRIRMLAFGDPLYLCPPQEKLLSFYAHVLPVGTMLSFVPDCDEEGRVFVDKSRLRVLSFPGTELVSPQEVPRLHTCRVASQATAALLRPRHVRRRALTAPAVATLVLRNEPRDVLNPREVFVGLNSTKGWRVRQTVLEALPVHEQLRIFADSDAILAMHGSGLVFHYWMGTGAVIVDFQYVRCWACFLALCSATDPSRELLYVLSTTPRTEDAIGLAARNLTVVSALARPLPVVGPGVIDWAVAKQRGRRVGLRAVMGLIEARKEQVRGAGALSLANAYRQWATALPRRFRVLDACAGAALQVREEHRAHAHA